MGGFFISGDLYFMRIFSRLAALGLLFYLIVTTVACSTNGNTTTFDTAALNKDATAIAYAVQVIETMPGVADHLSADDKAKFDSLVAQIKSITASIEASSGGAVTVDTGRDWAKSLGVDLKGLLNIASPIVQVYYPSASTYIQTVQSIIPLVEILSGLVSGPYGIISSYNADFIRDRIYKGV